MEVFRGGLTYSGVFKEGSEALASPPPLLGPPLDMFSAKIFLTFGEKLIIHSCNIFQKKIISKYSHFKGLPIAFIICMYFAFKRVPNSMCDMVICKCSASKGATNSNCNMQVLCFQKSPQQQVQSVSRLLCFQKAPQQHV